MEPTKQFKNEEERKKIMDRIKKILALANGTSFQGEAETAMRMAQGYMTSYGLSMTDIEIGEALDEAIVSEPIDRKSSPHQWERILGLAVAVVTDTKSYEKCSHNGSRLMFMGYKSDVDFAKILFLTMLVAIRMAAQGKYGKDKIYSHHRLSFRYGCAVRLGERAEEEKQTVVQAQENNRFALVVVEKKNRIDLWAKENLNLQNRSRKNGTSLNKEAYGQGRNHANNMDLMNRPKVSSQSTLTLGHSR